MFKWSYNLSSYSNKCPITPKTIKLNRWQSIELKRNSKHKILLRHHKRHQQETSLPSQCLEKRSYPQRKNTFSPPDSLWQIAKNTNHTDSVSQDPKIPVIPRYKENLHENNCKLSYSPTFRQDIGHRYQVRKQKQQEKLLTRTQGKHSVMRQLCQFKAQLPKDSNTKTNCTKNNKKTHYIK
eukprot:12391519-Ditylum_brightwellii.AAC.1